MKNSSPHHRYTLCILVVCLLTVAGCGRTPTDQLDLTTLLPGEPAWLVSADVPALRSSETWQELQGIWLGAPDALVDLDLFMEDAGIDADEDLDRLLAGLYPEGDAPGEFTAILTGRFTRETLLPELEKRGFSAVTHRDQTLIQPPAPESAGPGAPVHLKWYGVYFDDTAIGLADTREGAVALIDRRLDGGESLEQHSGFGPLLTEVDRTAPLWAAGLLPADATADLQAELPIQGMLPTLSNLGMSAGVSPQLQLTFVTLLSTAEEATGLAGQLNGWIKLAAGMIQANPQWFEGVDTGDDTLRLVAETLDKVLVSAAGPAVRLETTIPFELLQQAAQATSPGSPDHPRQESTPAHP